MNNVKFDLLNNINEREIIMIEERLDVLDKVKELVFMKGTEYMTTQQVADYYEVGLEAVKSITKRHKEELETNGLTLLKGKALKSFKGQVQDEPSIKFVSQLMLFSKRTILNIGMLLSDGDVAEQVRTLLLDNHEQLNNIHKKLDNGEEITNEDIDKSNPLYFVNREKELRQQEKDLNISLAEAINTGDMNKYMAIDCQMNKIKEYLLALE